MSEPAPRVAAFIGIHWSDAKHDICLALPDDGAQEQSVLEHRPAAIRAWAVAFRDRFHGAPIAVCIEPPQGPIVSALLDHDLFVIFPVNPSTLAKHRHAFTPRVFACSTSCPFPSGRDLDEIHRMLLDRLDAHVDDRFAVERSRMLPLPAHPFLARATHLPSVSRRSLITVDGAVYSVPCKWVGLDVTAHVGADDVQVANDRGVHRRPGEGAKRPSWSSACNAWLASDLHRCQLSELSNS
jgi:hypothetical protein